MTEQEYKDLANSQPKYYYEPRGREWALYEREKTAWEELRYLSIGTEKLSVSDAMN